MQFGNWIIGAVLTALLLGVGHWAPWPKQLSRLWSYTYGVASLWVGFAFWRGSQGDWETPIGLGLIVIIGGVAVFIYYQIDRWVTLIRKGWKAESLDDELAG